MEEATIEDSKLDLAYSLKAMTVDSFAMLSVKHQLQKFKRNEFGYLLEYDIDSTMSAFDELKLLQVTLTVLVSAIDKNDETKSIRVCQLQSTFDFSIKNYDSLKNKEGDIVVPQRLVVTLSSISYGTTRGLLFTRAQGNRLGNFTMPLMNLLSIPRKDLVIKKDEIAMRSTKSQD